MITKANPDRLIFVDMLDYAHDPVQGLVGEKIVQCFHFYDPHQFTHSHYIDDMPRLLGQWIEEVGDDLPPTRANIDNSGMVTLTNEADQYTYGKKDIEKKFKLYKDFSDSTGTPVMLTEFGDTVFNNVAYTARYYSDVLSTCEEFGFNWAHYSYDYIYWSYTYTWDIYKRHGATYTDLGHGQGGYFGDLQE